MTPLDPNHWANHPEFYNHPMIIALAQKPRWTVNYATPDGKNKMPISIDLFKFQHKIAGCTWPDDPDTPSLTTLPDIQKTMAEINHHAFRLHNPEDGVICLDVEKTCPDEMKRLFLRTNYIYGEVSLSGRGYHLFYPYPADLFQEFPNALGKIQIKGPNQHYEFLIDRHFVTFTRRTLPPPKSPDFDIATVMRPLWAEQKRAQLEHDLDIEVELDRIPEVDYILEMLEVRDFNKTLADYDQDESRYDLGLARFTYNRFLDLVSNWTFKTNGYVYTDEDALAVIAHRLNELRPERNDAKGPRNGIPWLTYQARHVISTSDKTTQETILENWAKLDKRK